MKIKGATPVVKNETDADAWLTTGRFAAILAGLIFVCFPLVVLGVETFYFRDFSCFTYPAALFYREAFWQGHLPFWNPYNSCGTPFLAQWNTVVLYPPSLLYLIFPLSWGLGMYCLGHLFFGGLGMYLLARRWTGNLLAASVAGAMFGFNGLSWDCMMWLSNGATLAWMPWVILSMEQAWREGGRKLILAGLAGAMQMLTGAPEIIILTWFVVGALWLSELTQAKIPRLRLGARFFFAGLLTAGLASAQLLPSISLVTHSQRGAAFGDSAWAMPLSGWLNYLMPLFHTVSDKAYFWQTSQFWTASYYLGTGTIALAILAVWRAPDRRTKLLAGLTFFGLVLALGDGGGLYKWLRLAAPFLNFMRYPIKFVVLPTFLIPLLAARGLAWFQSLPDEKWERERKTILQLGAGLLLVMAGGAWWEWFRPAEHEVPSVIAMNTAVRGVFLVLVLLCLLGLRRIEEFKLQCLLRVLLLLLFWFDIFTHSFNLSPTIDPVVYQPDMVRDYFKWGKELRMGESRGFPSRIVRDWLFSHSATDPVSDMSGRRLGLSLNYNLLDHAAKTDGFFSLELKEMSRVGIILYANTNDMSNFQDFLGVSHVCYNAVDWLPRQTHLPVITAGQEPVFTNDLAALQGALTPQFEPKQMVFIEPAAQAQIVAHRANVKINSRSFENEKVSAEVEADAPAMVVIAQSFYHCWHAYVDGKRVPLWRANYAFQALEVPAGRHEVRVVYEDEAFKIGAMISIASLLGAIAVWFWLAGKRGERRR